MRHRYAAGWFLACCLVAFLPAARAADYAIGADLSFLPQAEQQGIQFKEDNQPKSGIQLFKDHGYNWVRLRLFHSPVDLPNSLPYTLAAARDAQKLNLKFLLDLHYSDTWADPGKQFLPRAWQGKSHAELVQAVRQYTRDTLIACRDAGVMPDMVQIGNEVTTGMLWPDGKLPDHWDHFAELLQAGIDGVDDAMAAPPPPAAASADTAPAATSPATRPAPRPLRRPLIMIHIDRGGDLAGTRYFFDKVIRNYHINFDVIGQSYYPWWHGTLLDLRENLAFMAKTYQKDIIVVETAYCWQPTEYSPAPRRPRLAPFPESPDGQRAFLEELQRIILETPDQRGKGLFYWEPAVGRGSLRSRGLFDLSNNALPALTAFDKWTRR